MVKPLKKAIKNNKMSILDDFGTKEYGNEMESAEKFFRQWFIVEKIMKQLLKQDAECMTSKNRKRVLI